MHFSGTYIYIGAFCFSLTSAVYHGVFEKGVHVLYCLGLGQSLGESKLTSHCKAMAEAPDITDKVLDELEKEITCAICQGHYQHAKLLPCNQYYCTACIEKMKKHAREKPFDCPDCRKETRLPPGGVPELQGAFLVGRLKDVHSKMAKAEGKVEAVCEQCGGAASVAFCRQCAEFICDDCAGSHRKMKAFVGHVVASLEDLKKGGAKNIPLKEVRPPKCPNHNKSVKIFCFNCNCLICQDCTIIDHNGHNFNFLTKCAPESRKILRDSLVSLQKLQADIAAAKKTLDSEEAKVDSQKKEVCQSIEQSFGMLKALLDWRKAESVKKASSLAKEKMDALTAQKKGLQVAQTEIQGLVEFIERNIEMTSDYDLMCICTELEIKIEEEEKRHRQLSLEPSATPNIFCIPPSPEDIPKHLGDVFDKSTPRALLRDINATIPCELGTTMELSVSAPTAVPADISTSVKCVSNPSSSLQGNVVQKGVGMYSITFTPQVRGRHDLILKVKDKEINGSPFRVFVKISPAQLGQPVCKIGGLNWPWGITIDNKQQLVVVDSGIGGNKISIMERDGRRVQTIECTEFQDPRGVATAQDQSIYVTDIKAHCLFKFDTMGRHLKTVHGELQWPSSVKIIHNQLYVVDRDKSLVKIFDMDCNVVGNIQTKECPNPLDIANGPDGLYVAGDKKISVYACAPNGMFIHHLNIQPSSLKLSQFCGICFDSRGHLIATDYGNGVYVFKPSGEHIASSDLVSSDEIEHPSGVAVDEDGFMYVCGFRSHNVVVFSLEC